MKKKTLPQLKKELWKIFSLYIRTRDRGICFTCGRQASGSGYHAGHFRKAATCGLTLYFHEDNVHGQCYNCNINLDGDQYNYGKKLGDDMVNVLDKIKLSTKGLKWDREIYEVKIAYYKKKLKVLAAELKKLGGG